MSEFWRNYHSPVVCTVKAGGVTQREQFLGRECILQKLSSVRLPWSFQQGTWRAKVWTWEAL